MEFIEHIILYMQTVPGIYVVLIACFFAFIENIIPPMPSDVILIFAATFIAFGSVRFVPLLISTTICSASGFTTMYFIGSGIDRKVFDEGKIKFITPNALQKVDKWFEKWGYAVIVANRFLSGTRAVISFFAGMVHLKFHITLPLAAVSSFVWNFILIYLGYKFGENWRVAWGYVQKYNEIAFIIIGLFVLFVVIRIFIRRKKSVKDTRE
ncbi:MAG TPA: DedA family protein [Bacteroidota bacterium]|nr:DedA family protein [Bacteroidota bacterium]